MFVSQGSKPLRLGFLPETDCAPIVAAQELGIFKRYGLTVELQSQASWKHVHDKIIYGQLDAAHAPAMLPFLIRLGLCSEAANCITGLVLSLQGNGITISRQLWNQGVRDAGTMREQMWKDRHKRIYTFGVSCPLSSQYALLCGWLRSPGSPPYTEVRIDTVAPEQMFPLLKLGYLDGYCSGEPWNSVAVQAGVGVCMATSAELAPMHPEKVLLVREEFAQSHADEHERLIAALIEACALCDDPRQRASLCEILAQSRYVNAPVDCLKPGLTELSRPSSTVSSGAPSIQNSNIPIFQSLSSIFSRSRANEPAAAKSAWLTGRLFEFLRWPSRPAALSKVFRPDIYRRAVGLIPSANIKLQTPNTKANAKLQTSNTKLQKKRPPGLVSAI
ncbi:MAG: nitrate ABC transporter ATP-binding protein [Verrucomicrobia bacterium]|nr:MAG: nitrate ABC transporter ATP-binding protein [Verrucomicrobiota bacterium]